MTTTPISLADAGREERIARRFWGGFIGILLSSQLAIGVLAVVLSRSDPSQSIVPDYHERALRWDRTREARDRSAALHWHVEFSVSAEPDADGKRIITLVVHDASNQPITGCIGSLRGYHRSRAAQAQVVILDELASGIYRAPAFINRAGLWQFEITLNRGSDESFLDERLVELPGAKR